MYWWYLFVGSLLHTNVRDCCCYYCCCYWTYCVCTCLLLHLVGSQDGLTPIASDGLPGWLFHFCCWVESEQYFGNLLRKFSTFYQVFFHAVTTAFWSWSPKYIFSNSGRACLQAPSIPDSWLTYSHIINYITHECSQIHTNTSVRNIRLPGSDKLSLERQEWSFQTFLCPFSKAGTGYVCSVSTLCCPLFVLTHRHVHHKSCIIVPMRDYY